MKKIYFLILIIVFFSTHVIYAQSPDDLIHANDRKVHKVIFSSFQDINYLEAFTKGNIINFSIVIGERSYNLELKKGFNTFSEEKEGYEGVVSGTTTRATIRVYKDKITGYIYEPMGRIKISTTLSEYQKKFNAACAKVGLSSIKKIGKYYIVDDNEVGEQLESMPALVEMIKNDKGSYGDVESSETRSPTAVARNPFPKAPSNGNIIQLKPYRTPSRLCTRSLDVYFWELDRSVDDRDDIEENISESLNNVYYGAAFNFTWIDYNNNYRYIHDHFDNKINKISNADTQLNQFRNYLFDYYLNMGTEIHLLMTESDWDDVAGKANRPGSAGIASDNSEQTAAHEVGHLMGAGHDDKVKYDGWWYSSIMHSGHSYFRGQKNVFFSDRDVVAKRLVKLSAPTEPERSGNFTDISLDNKKVSVTYRSNTGNTPKLGDLKKQPYLFIDELDKKDMIWDGGNWSSKSKKYQRATYYRVTVKETGKYLIDLESRVDPYVYVMTRYGLFITKDDDGYPGKGLAKYWSRTRWIYFQKGTVYWIIASHFNAKTSGDMKMRIWSNKALSRYTGYRLATNDIGEDIPLAKNNPSDLGYSNEIKNDFVSLLESDGNTKPYVFPNPSLSGEFEIKTKDNDLTGYTVEVYNVLGQLILKRSLSQRTEMIQHNLTAGIYLINIFDELGNKSTGELIVK